MVFINTKQIVYCRGEPGSRKVSITFDDGPSEGYTEEILELLERHGSKATFFMIGRNVEKYPEIARKVCQSGHEIGNHTYNHSSLFLDTPRRIAMELAMGEEIIKKVTGVTTRFFRPPYGARTRWVVTQALRRGYVITKWSVNAGDWRRASAERIVRKTLARISSGDIILMHDGTSLARNNHRKGTVSALREILDWLKNTGHEVVNISSLLGLEGLSSE